jgi:hypothetical protein
MPLTELNENNKFDDENEVIGFAVYTLDNADFSQGEWPDSANAENPSTWGDLTSTLPEFHIILIPMLLFLIFIAIVSRRRR